LIPGLSSLERRPQDVAEYLKPMLEFALAAVPVDKHSSTPFFLFATAGMRIVPQPNRSLILLNSCAFVKQNSEFIIDSCDTNFRVISGELEG
jgi:Golgi nucleoside diphosphatase